MSPLKPSRSRPRCSYCRMPSDVWFTYRGYLSACIVRKQPVVTVGACAAHEGCVNFQSLLADPRIKGIELARSK